MVGATDWLDSCVGNGRADKSALNAIRKELEERDQAIERLEDALRRQDEVKDQLITLQAQLEAEMHELRQILSSDQRLLEVSAPAPASVVTLPSAAWTTDLLVAALGRVTGAVQRATSGPLQPLRPLPPPLPAPRAAEMCTLAFDIFKVPDVELPALAYAALVAQPETSARTHEVDVTVLWRFVCEVSSFYHPRPFHSFRHAVDVLLTTCCLLRLVQHDHPAKLTDSLDTLALLVGALLHDVNHPGCMNSLLVAIDHPLAAGGPTGVLERHHAAVAVALLERPELNFLPTLSAAARAAFVQRVREVILATDVATTMPRVKELSETTQSGGTLDGGFLLNMLIKAADISNPTRALPIYSRWIDGIIAEFFIQGDVERERSLPISMNCERAAVVVAKAQVGFISFLVGPLFAALAAFSPSLQPFADALYANKAHFAAMST